jgi:hypothetical protein
MDIILSIVILIYFRTVHGKPIPIRVDRPILPHIRDHPHHGEPPEVGGEDQFECMKVIYN